MLTIWDFILTQDWDPRSRVITMLWTAVTFAATQGKTILDFMIVTIRIIVAQQPVNR
jgi:hypothetical protein